MSRVGCRELRVESGVLRVHVKSGVSRVASRELDVENGVLRLAC